MINSPKKLYAGRRPRTFKPPMYFRQLRESDYRSMRDIFHDAFDCCRLPIVDFGFSWRERSRLHSLGLFTRAGDLVGFAIVSIHPQNGGNRYLDYIAVHSAFRGGGTGSSILRRVVGDCYAERRGIHLYPLRRAKAWYKSHGFEYTTAEYMNFHPYPTRRIAWAQKDLA
jgi:GNAT superfamily N-acetyltransferase